MTGNFKEDAGLLKEIVTTLEASKEAYLDYLGNGKTFSHAETIKKHNSRIMELLGSQKKLLSPSLQQDAAALLVHYNAWTEKWDALAAALNPKADDVFIFANNITFPKHAAQNLETAYKQLTHISVANEKDIPALTALLSTSYRGEASKKGWTTEADLIDGNLRTDEANIKGLMEQQDAVFLKYSSAENETEGCVFLQKKENKLYLGMLSVSPLIQAKGIGKQLMTAAALYAKQINCHVIFMRVISLRYELIAWYEKQGYKKTGATEPFPDDTEFGKPRQPLEFLIMEKQLNSR